MSSISSITKAVSGIKTAQKGLQVTGHNLTNTNTKGYTRQQLLQHETGYLNIGQNGGRLFQLGLGVSDTEIRQIRDDMADARYRVQRSSLSYYQTSTSALNEIVATFDEPYGDGLGDMIQALWGYAQKLETTPDGVEERSSFVSAASVLASKIGFIADSLTDYQITLDAQVKKSVDRVNEIIKGIADLNEKIAKYEINSDRANDYRDERNLLIDELSEYGEVTYYADEKSYITVSFAGKKVVDKTATNLLELKPAKPNSSFVTPCWEDTGTEVFKLDKPISSLDENDKGSLKALLVLRGNDIFTEDMTWDDVALDKKLSVDVQGNNFIIPEIQMKLNVFTQKLAKVVNDNLKGTGMGVWQGKPGIPVFVNKSVRREDYASDAEFSEAQRTGLMSTNIIVNPELLTKGGYNALGTVNSHDASGNIDPEKVDSTGDSSLISNMLAEWKKAEDWYGGGTSSPVQKHVNLNTFYIDLATEIGADTELATKKSEQIGITINNIENERQAMGGVSMDEEFTSMLKYQYAYNASSRMITMLDSMLDTIINRM